jgi:hypothetical protein
MYTNTEQYFWKYVHQITLNPICSICFSMFSMFYLFIPCFLLCLPVNGFSLNVVFSGARRYCDYFIATCDAPSGPIGRYYSGRSAQFVCVVWRSPEMVMGPMCLGNMHIYNYVYIYSHWVPVKDAMVDCSSDRPTIRRWKYWRNVLASSSPVFAHLDLGLWKWPKTALILYCI